MGCHPDSLLRKTKAESCERGDDSGEEKQEVITNVMEEFPEEESPGETKASCLDSCLFTLSWGLLVGELRAGCLPAGP